MSPLAGVFSAAISTIIDNGDYEHLYRRWFGTSPGSPTHPYPPVARRSFPTKDSEPALASLLDRGQLRWGHALLGPPFSFLANEDECKDPRPRDRATGWDLELAALLTRTIARGYDTAIEAVMRCTTASPFPARLFDELDAGHIDAILSDLAITDERQQRADFTAPYLRATFGLLCRNENQADQLADLRSANRPVSRILILRKAFLNELADRYLPRATRVFVDDPQDLSRFLLDGRGQAALLPFASIHAYRTRYPELTCPDFCVGPGALRAIAVRKT